MKLTRRHVLKAGAAIALLSGCQRHKGPWGQDVAQIDRTALGAVGRPSDTAGVQKILSTWDGPICVAGGRYSMGGQTRAPGALQLDMDGVDELLSLDVETKVVKVGAGMRWRALQEHLDPQGLSVKVMQSYSNFSVGGSISVNCHGRYVGGGCIAGTVRALTLVLPDGQRRDVSRSQDPELFAAALGGYGGVGVITEVELDLADNQRILRQVQDVSLAEYPQWFAAQILEQPGMVLHNADLTPPKFDAPLAISWRATQDPLTDLERLTPHGARHGREQNMIWSVTELPGGHSMREHFVTGQLRSEPKVSWRNRQASLDVASLEPRTRIMSTYLLQEYFVPAEAFGDFVAAMRRILSRYEPNLLNISIRHARADETTLLPWAASEVFCFVLYYKQRNFDWVDEANGRWTRELVSAALDHGGRHYLPYRLHAARGQVWQGYPGLDRWLAVKARTDPGARLRNLMIDKYFL